MFYIVTVRLPRAKHLQDGLRLQDHNNTGPQYHKSIGRAYITFLSPPFFFSPHLKVKLCFGTGKVTQGTGHVTDTLY